MVGGGEVVIKRKYNVCTAMKLKKKKCFPGNVHHHPPNPRKFLYRNREISFKHFLQHYFYVSTCGFTF